MTTQRKYTTRNTTRRRKVRQDFRTTAQIFSHSSAEFPRNHTGFGHYRTDIFAQPHRTVARPHRILAQPHRISAHPISSQRARRNCSRPGEGIHSAECIPEAKVVARLAVRGASRFHLYDPNDLNWWSCGGLAGNLFLALDKRYTPANTMSPGRRPDRFLQAAEKPGATR